MTSVALARPALAASLYERWHRHFWGNRNSARGLPWSDAYQLSALERAVVGRSIQQFQLGEWARGRGFKRRAAAERALAADAWFLPALELFIAEEQRHSRILGQFLDREGMPRFERQWTDTVFRRLRKLAGLEVCAMVLVTAEVLAIPFYQALRDATRSELLRSICVRILCDEAAHVNYQALTLGLVRRPMGERARAIRFFCHALFFRGTALLLWQQHRKVFRAAGWGFVRFWNEARREFAHLQLGIERLAAGRRCAECFDEMRLD
jgi:hypothetical protein